MDVSINNDIMKCHCPVVGRIGSIVFEDVPCLLSKSDDPSRKMKYTVELSQLIIKTLGLGSTKIRSAIA